MVSTLEQLVKSVDALHRRLSLIDGGVNRSKKKLIYMKDLNGNNLEVFTSIASICTKYDISDFDIKKSINGLEVKNLDCTFEEKEVLI